MMRRASNGEGINELKKQFPQVCRWRTIYKVFHLHLSNNFKSMSQYLVHEPLLVYKVLSLPDGTYDLLRQFRNKSDGEEQTSFGVWLRVLHLDNVFQALKDTHQPDHVKGLK